MLNTFCKSPLWECHATLVRAAQGLEPADTVIRHANLVSVTTHEVLPDADIAISCGRIAYLGLDGHTAEHCIGPKTRVIDAAGRYVAPGYIDSHIHIESAMIGPAEYARVVAPRGTTAIYADPHECANVVGLEGVRVMFDDARRAPLKAMLTTPSCVPAVTGFDDAGASVDAAQVAQTMAWDDVVGLGEMMNFPGILAGERNALDEVAETLKAGKCVTGHYSVSETDRGLAAYIASGVRACHESITPEDVIAKLRCGMYVQARYGSAWLSLPGYLPQVLASGVDTRLICLCTDDNHPNTLVSEGGMDRALRACVAAGADAVTALQFATINAAQMLGIDADMGSVTPGKCADLVILPNLETFVPDEVLIDGELVAQGGRALFDNPLFAWPDFMMHTMNVGRTFSPADFEIHVDRPDGYARVRAIGGVGGSTITRDTVIEVPVRNGRLEANPEIDALKMAVFDRHHGAAGTHSFGFCTGFGVHGALAQTVSHDSHNLLVVGDNDEDMAIAAQALVDCGGGEVAVADGQVLALVRLPVCGLMSDAHVEQVAAEVARIEQAWAEMGCKMPSPFMTMGILSLPCVPELRLTNRGYVNCVTFEFEDLLVED